jgi:hypothetical protein
LDGLGTGCGSKAGIAHGRIDGSRILLVEGQWR